MYDLSEKTAVVTGGASGMGKVTAERLALAGATVIACDRQAFEAQSPSGARGSIEAVRCDVTIETDVEHLIADARDVNGNVQILCNCAGIFPTAPLIDATVEEVRNVLDVNLVGTFLPCKHALPGMRGARDGSIINWGSTNSFVANEFCGAYCASKGAVVMLTKTIAIENGAYQVRANAICPGWVDTPLNDKFVDDLGGAEAAEKWLRNFQPAGMTQPEEVAEMAAFLASDAARTITGAALMIDGGLTAQ